MHEYSIVRALADRVVAEARARRALAVHRLTVAIGSLSGVEPELLSTAFDLCREGLLAETRLEVRRVEATWGCPRCGLPIGADGPLSCAACGEPARLGAGDEILLEQIEMEVP